MQMSVEQYSISKEEICNQTLKVIKVITLTCPFSKNELSCVEYVILTCSHHREYETTLHSSLNQLVELNLLIPQETFQVVDCLSLADGTLLLTSLRLMSNVESLWFADDVDDEDICDLLSATNESDFVSFDEKTPPRQEAFQFHNNDQSQLLSPEFMLVAHPLPDPKVAFTSRIKNPFLDAITKNPKHKKGHNCFPQQPPIHENDIALITRGKLQGSVVQVIASLLFADAPSHKYLVRLHDGGKHLVVAAEQLKVVQPLQPELSITPTPIEDMGFPLPLTPKFFNEIPHQEFDIGELSMNLQLDGDFFDF